MNRNELLVTGAVAVGVGGYLAYAYSKCKFPFENIKKCKGPSPVPPCPPG